MSRPERLPAQLSTLRLDPGPPPADPATDPGSYLVLAQKALTYQADFQLDDWGTLLADDVELHLPGRAGPVRLVGRKRVLQYWKQ